MIKQNVSSHCYLKDRRVWYELRFWTGMSSLAQGEYRLNQFLKMLPSTFQEHSWLPLKKPPPRLNEQSNNSVCIYWKNHHRLSWLHRFAHGLSTSMEERATEAQRTARLSFERDPSRSGSRTDQGKDVHWVVPAETKLPPKVVGIAVSNDPLDRGMLRELARFDRTTGRTWISVSTSQRWLVFGQT